MTDANERTGQNENAPDRNEKKQPRNQFYKVIFTAADNGFELAEHRLSKQLLFIFCGIPNLELAGKLEAMGFDHSDDEHMFTVDSTAANRHKALRLAQQFSSRSSESQR